MHSGLHLVTQVSPFNYEKNKSWPPALWNVSGLRRELFMEFFSFPPSQSAGANDFSENLNVYGERKNKTFVSEFHLKKSANLFDSVSQSVKMDNWGSVLLGGVGVQQ